MHYHYHLTPLFSLFHDYKPNPYNPLGQSQRMPGRKPRPRDLNEMGLL